MVLLLISGVIKVIKFFVGLLPGISFDEYNVPDTITEIVNLLDYILPMDTLDAIFSATLVITGFRLILSIVNKILDILDVI